MWFYSLMRRDRLRQIGLVDDSISYASSLLLDALSSEWPRAVAEVQRERREDAQIRDTTAKLAMLRGL